MVMGERIELPEPTRSFLFEELLNRRDSVRQFQNELPTMVQLSRILWAGYGKNGRTVSSAGACYPLKIYVILESKVYQYNSSFLELVTDKVEEINYHNAPVIILIAANYEKMTKRYGKRAHRYLYIETGHVLQNIVIEAMHLELASVVVGGFRDGKIKRLLNIPHDPVCFICIGKSAKENL